MNIANGFIGDAHEGLVLGSGLVGVMSRPLGSGDLVFVQPVVSFWKGIYLTSPCL